MQRWLAHAGAEVGSLCAPHTSYRDGCIARIGNVFRRYRAHAAAKDAKCAAFKWVSRIMRRKFVSGFGPTQIFSLFLAGGRVEGQAALVTRVWTLRSGRLPLAITITLVATLHRQRGQ